MRALVVFCLFWIALPALAATPRECQQFLRAHSPRMQCGPTCVPHTLIGLLEMHLQKPLSIEYALLNEGVQKVRDTLPITLAPGVRSWVAALLSIGHGGVQTEEQFLSFESRFWFRNRFQAELNELGVLALSIQRVGLHRDPWWREQQRAASRVWAELAPKLEFQFVVADARAVDDFRAYESELHALGLNIRFEYETRDEIELEVVHSLNVGYPAGVILEPLEGMRHAEIALRREADGSMITRNTAQVRHWYFWEKPAPNLIRSEQKFRKKLVGALFVREAAD